MIGLTYSLLQYQIMRHSGVLSTSLHPQNELGLSAGYVYIGQKQPVSQEIFFLVKLMAHSHFWYNIHFSSTYQ